MQSHLTSLTDFQRLYCHEFYQLPISQLPFLLYNTEKSLKKLWTHVWNSESLIEEIRITLIHEREDKESFIDITTPTPHSNINLFMRLIERKSLELDLTQNPVREINIQLYPKHKKSKLFVLKTPKKHEIDEDRFIIALKSADAKSSIANTYTTVRVKNIV